jgi:uncharacterized protein (DUF302 family)
MAKRDSAQPEETTMLAAFKRSVSVAALVLGLSLMASLPSASSETSRASATSDGVVRVKSAYGVGETIGRLKADIAAKGIMFFTSVDQSKLAADVGIALRPSTLLMFGNPPLGTQFITANANAGLDWPVRLLVTQDESGAVWAVYTDFQWIARRHGITDRDPQFKMASEVIASITSSVAAK